jgi:PAS domain S-box-containing protein
MHHLALAQSPLSGRSTPAPGPSRTNHGWESLFQAVLQNARNPMALLDEDARILDVNRPAMAMTGFPRAELVGRVADEFVVEEERADFAHEWQELVLRGDDVAEHELICAGGGRVTVRYKASRRAVGSGARVLFLATHVRQGPKAAVQDAASIRAFSPREREIVRLVAQGLTTRDIADDLGLAIETVRTHIRNAMGKLGARTRAQLVGKAMAERLI